MDTTLIQSVYSEVKKNLEALHKRKKIVKIFQIFVWGIYGFLLIWIGFATFNSYFPAYHNKYLDWMNVSGGTFGNSFSFSPTIFVFLIGMIFTSISSYFFIHHLKKDKALESKTMGVMVRRLFPDAEFSQVTQLPVKQIRQSEFFSSLPEASPCVTYGYMRKVWKNVSIDIADIGIKEDNTSQRISKTLLSIPYLNIIVIFYQFVVKNILSSKSADNLYYTFRGMYCWATFNKKLEARTVIISNEIQGVLDRLINFSLKDKEVVNLEDIRFTKQFNVYSTDQIESRYILSTKMMEKITEFSDKLKKPIMISFLQNKMYLAIYNPNGIFSFPIESIDSVKIVEDFVVGIEMAQEIIDCFELNKKFQ